MRWLAVLAIVGCHRGPPPQRSLANTSAVPRVTLRMAREHEFGVDRSIYCEPRGALADELYQPMVDFAVTHLVQELDEATHGDPIRSRRIVDSRQDATGGPGIDVAVNARTAVGEIRLTLIREDWHAGINYCVHVVSEGGARMLVVDRLTDWSTPRTWSVAPPPSP